MVVGVITEVSTEPRSEPDIGSVARVELAGEIRTDDSGKRCFCRGVTAYPAIDDRVFVAGPEDLRLVFGVGGPSSLNLGSLHQDIGISAHVEVDEMLRKHFAIFGTTGVGKSSGVAVILREVLARKPDLRLFLIDVHNEYGRCFGDLAVSLTPANLRLPFWLFNFEEIIDVFYRGRPGIDEEVDILSEVIPQAKRMYGIARGGNDPGHTVDTPVPYRLGDLIALIDDRMGKLENRSSRVTYNKLIQRIQGVVNDPRYAFMFEGANVGGDTMAAVIRQLFRVPADSRPMTVLQIAGFPSEVVDSVVSVVGRMAFDFGLWSDGAVPLLFVCEEAHRYASANHSRGFGPTRRAISRIAKEGRKYGVFLGLISQRPAELDPTIISQCSTLFVMRLANERDQAIIRSAVSDGQASLLNFIPALGTREVFAFGEGVAMPTRLRFRELTADQLPRSESVVDGRTLERVGDPGFIEAVLDRWRGAMTTNRIKPDEEGPAAAPAPVPLDPQRYSILKKPAGTFGGGR
jgi:DNA helicase HerA-like ATPase